MTKYVCTDCGGDLVQMLKREPWDATLDEKFRTASKHYGFYCKACLQMFKEKMYLEKDKVREVEEPE